MSVRRIGWLVLPVLCFLAGGPAERACAQAAPKYEDVLQAESKVPIEFQGDWDATWKHNQEAWAKDKAFMANPRRQAIRGARLLEAMLQKFPVSGDQREKVVYEIVDRYINLGYRREACQALQKLIDALPGQFDVAIAALHKMLLQAIPWDRPAYCENGSEWVDYAATRLIALRQAGQLAKSHSAHQLALRILVGLRRDQGRLSESLRFLADMEEVTGPSNWIKQQRAEALVAAGRVEEPAAMYRELASQADDEQVRNRSAELQGVRASDAPKFLRKMAVEATCDSLAGRDLKDQVQTIQKIILDDAAGQVPLVREMPVTSAWCWMDRMLLSQEAGLLLKLRQSQQQAALDAQKIGAAAEVRGLGLFRRYPWAEASHRALLEQGQDWLLQGRAQAAMRCFQDALTHAADPTLRRQARAGLLTALSQTDPTAQQAEEAFKGVDPAAVFEWQGRSFKLQDIRQRLAENGDNPRLATAGTVPGSGGPIPVRNLSMPAASAWAANLMVQDIPCQLLAIHDNLPSLRVSGPDVIVGGPSLIACYGSDLSKPRWAVGPRPRKGFLNEYRGDWEPRYYTISPAEVRPCAGGGRVFGRWGQEPAGRFFEAIAAFDQADGRLLWSSQDQNAWQGLAPSSDPVYHEGRVYTLALQRGLAPILTAFLVCNDALTGQTAWKRAIASTDPSLPGEPALDVAHYGNPVTVRDGAVYVQTNMGVVARYDLRDGQLEWAHVYPRGSADGWQRPAFLNRRGAAPGIAGPAVLFLPRDAGGAFALARDTGKPLWQQPVLPSESWVGQQGTVAFLRNEHSVAAVEAVSGNVLWERYQDEPIHAAGLLGAGVLIDNGKELVQLSTADGLRLGQQPWKEPVLSFVPRDGGLLAITPYAVNQDVGQPLNPSAQELPLALPLARAWHLPRPAARLVEPPPEARMPGRVLLLSQNLIECLTPSAKGQIDWRLLVEGGFTLAWTDKKLLVIYPEKVLAVGPDGKILWQARAPFPVRRHLVAGPYLVLQANANGWESNGRGTAAMDLNTGQVLWENHWRREFNYPEWKAPFRGMAYDGQNLHLFGHFEPYQSCDVVVRPAEGTILDIVRVFDFGIGGPALQGAWGLTHDYLRRLYEFDLSRPASLKPFAADVRAMLYLDGRAFQLERAVHMADPWARLVKVDPYYHREDRTVIIKRGDPAYEVTILAIGELYGDLLVASNPAGAVIVHLPTKKQIQFNMPLTAEHVGKPLKPLGAWELGNQYLLASGMIRDGQGGWPVHVRVDVLDRQTGASQGCQVLEDVLMGRLAAINASFAVENQTLRVGQTLLVTDVNGLHAFVHSPQAPITSLSPLPATRCAPGSIRMDGFMDEWPETTPLTFKDRRGQAGQLRLAWDGSALYGAISYHCGDFQPRKGRGPFGAGAMLEINLQAGPFSHKANLSLDARGRLVVEYAGEQALWVRQYGHSYDPAAGEIVMKFAVPTENWARTGFGPLQMSFSAWEDSTALGAQPLFTVRAQMPEIEPVKADPPKPPRRR